MGVFAYVGAILWYCLCHATTLSSMKPSIDVL